MPCHRSPLIRLDSQRTQSRGYLMKTSLRSYPPHRCYPTSPHRLDHLGPPPPGCRKYLSYGISHPFIQMADARPVS